jgi:hypothetical protein
MLCCFKPCEEAINGNMSQLSAGYCSNWGFGRVMSRAAASVLVGFSPIPVLSKASR